MASAGFWGCAAARRARSRPIPRASQISGPPRLCHGSPNTAGTGPADLEPARSRRLIARACREHEVRQPIGIAAHTDHPARSRDRRRSRSRPRAGTARRSRAFAQPVQQRHDLVDAVAGSGEGLGDGPDRVGGPERLEPVIVGADAGVGEAGGQVADGGLVLNHVQAFFHCRHGHVCSGQATSRSAAAPSASRSASTSAGSSSVAALTFSRR